MAYFPNSTSGMAFDEACCDCLHSDPDAGCPVALVQMWYNYEQVDKGQELLRQCLTQLVGDDGRCKMKPLIEKYYTKKKLPPDDNMYVSKKWGA